METSKYILKILKRLKTFCICQANETERFLDPLRKVNFMYIKP